MRVTMPEAPAFGRLVGMKRSGPARWEYRPSAPHYSRQELAQALRFLRRVQYAEFF